MVTPKLSGYTTESNSVCEAIGVLFEIQEIQEELKKAQSVLYKKTTIATNSDTIEQLTKQFQSTRLYNTNSPIKIKINTFLSKFIFRKEISKINLLNNELSVNINVLKGIISTDSFKSELIDYYNLLKDRIIQQNDIKDKYGEYSNTYLSCKVVNRLIKDDKSDINEKITNLINMHELAKSLSLELNPDKLIEEESLHIFLSKLTHEERNKDEKTYLRTKIQ